MIKLARAIGFPLLLVPCVVFASVVGEYTITTDTQPMGEVVSKLIIRADGTGHMSNYLGAYELTDIYIDGDAFEFEIVADTPWGDRTVTYVGKVDGDKVSGDRLSDMGNSTFEGTRSDPTNETD